MNQPKQTLIFAHRGANKEAAENTRSAFDKALEYAIDGIETDVQLSRDEVAVLWHDRFLDKLGMPDKHIDDFDHSQLQRMSFDARFFPEAEQESIMSLQDFLEAYRKRCRLLIEIKNREWEEFARHEIKVQKTLNMIGKVSDDTITVSSFNLGSLVYANKYNAGFPLVYNIESDQTFADLRRVLVSYPFLSGLCLPIEVFDETMVKLLRSCRKKIGVYTCNSDDEINKALAFGVDILVTDVPQKALAMRNQ